MQLGHRCVWPGMHRVLVLARSSVRAGRQAGQAGQAGQAHRRGAATRVRAFAAAQLQLHAWAHTGQRMVNGGSSAIAHTPTCKLPSRTAASDLASSTQHGRESAVQLPPPPSPMPHAKRTHLQPPS